MRCAEIDLTCCLVSLVFVQWTLAKNETNATSVILKFRDSGEKSRIASNYKEERKVKTFFPDNIADNETSEENINRDISFPRSLVIIPEILLKIDNERCIRDTTLALEAMTRHERWTLEMFDAFPKFPVGILSGNHYQLGNFDECVQARQPKMPRSDERIRGQYCLTDIHFTNGQNDNPTKFMDKIQKVNSRFTFNNSVVHWGICLPESCNTNDSKIFVEEIFKSVMDEVKIVQVTIGERKCHVDKSLPLNTLEIIYGAIIGVFLMFICFATAFHCWTLRRRQSFVAYTIDTVREQTSTLKEVILCFSLIRTIKKFLHTSPSELNLECICGIKIISMMFIISGHTLIFLAGGPVDNVNFVKEQAHLLQNAIFFNNALLVDTFLIVSGFLMCRLMLIELDKRKGRVNFLILYIARYIRLTPSYIVVLGFYCTFLIRLGSGPFWDARIGTEQEKCMQSWWTNLLYINNYVNTDYLCMFQAWYLAVDYHLFIVAPFIIYPLWKWNKIGESLLVICLIPSIAVPTWTTYTKELDPTLLAFPPEVEDISRNYYFKNFYIKTHMRTSSYLIGILFGYIVHRLQSAGQKIPSYVIWIGSVIASISAILSLFSIVVFFMPDHEKNNIENTIYSSLHRVAWCFSIGWVLIICITDNCAIINKFLSWKLFVPMSRLTYCAYLINGFVEIYHMGTIRQNTYMNLYNLLCTVFAHLIITLALAFVVCILFESPIHGLEKILLSKEKSTKQHQRSISDR